MLAVAIVTVAIYLGFALVLVGGWSLGASVRGSTSGLGPDFWANLAATIGRCVVAAVVLAEITAALVFVTRSTVGAVITWFGYLVGIEAMLTARIPELRPSLLLANLAAFLQGSVLRISIGGFGDVVHLARPGPGLLRTVGIAVVVGALGIWAFQRRDVV